MHCKLANLGEKTLAAPVSCGWRSHDPEWTPQNHVTFLTNERPCLVSRRSSSSINLYQPSPGYCTPLDMPNKPKKEKVSDTDLIFSFKHIYNPIQQGILCKKWNNAQRWVLLGLNLKNKPADMQRMLMQYERSVFKFISDDSKDDRKCENDDQGKHRKCG